MGGVDSVHDVGNRLIAFDPAQGFRSAGDNHIIVAGGNPKRAFGVDEEFIGLDVSELGEIDLGAGDFGGIGDDGAVFVAGFAGFGEEDDVAVVTGVDRAFIDDSRRGGGVFGLVEVGEIDDEFGTAAEVAQRDGLLGGDEADLAGVDRSGVLDVLADEGDGVGVDLTGVDDVAFGFAEEIQITGHEVVVEDVHRRSDDGTDVDAGIRAEIDAVLVDQIEVPGGVQITEDVGRIVADDSCEHGGGGVDLVDIDGIAFVDTEFLPVDDGLLCGLVNVHDLSVDGDGDFAFHHFIAGRQRTGQQSAR